MSHRRTVTLDEDKVSRVAAILNTDGIRATIDAALDHILNERRERQLAAIRRMGELSGPTDAERQTMWKQ